MIGHRPTQANADFIVAKRLQSHIRGGQRVSAAK